MFDDQLQISTSFVQLAKLIYDQEVQFVNSETDFSNDYYQINISIK